MISSLLCCSLGFSAVSSLTNPDLELFKVSSLGEEFPVIDPFTVVILEPSVLLSILSSSSLSKSNNPSTAPAVASATAASASARAASSACLIASSSSNSLKYKNINPHLSTRPGNLIFKLAQVQSLSYLRAKLIYYFLA